MTFTQSIKQAFKGDYSALLKLEKGLIIHKNLHNQVIDIKPFTPTCNQKGNIIIPAYFENGHLHPESNVIINSE